MKKIFVFILSLMLVFTAVPVYADTSEGDQIKVECNKLSDNDEPYTTKDADGNEITVYTLSALKRDDNQKIELPISRYFTLTSQSVDLSDITAEMDTESDNGQGKKDIKLTVTEKTSNEAEIEANFSNQKVTTQLNSNAGILIKKGEKVIKRIAFSYSTPALTDEHDAKKFHDLSAWSGKLQYDYDTGEQYKISGMVDVYQTNAKLSYTYQSLGTYGVNAFMLDEDGSFTFSNGKTTWKAKTEVQNKRIRSH